MKNYTKIYFDYFDYKVQEEVMCEGCGRPANDIHHIKGRGRGMDVIQNLMALCRKCHEKAHSTLSKSELQFIHNNVMQGNRKRYIK